jgi:hypothetical protein
MEAKSLSNGNCSNVNGGELMSMVIGGWIVETKRRYLNYVIKVKSRSRKERLVRVFGCWA